MPTKAKAVEGAEDPEEKEKEESKAAPAKEITENQVVKMRMKISVAPEDLAAQLMEKVEPSDSE